MGWVGYTLKVSILFYYIMVEKLNRLKVEKKLKSLGIGVFSPLEFKGIFGVSGKTASVFINRNLASGLFLKVRNNFYVLKDSPPSAYVTANKLYQPSYVSLEKALAYYGIIPETVYTVTSLTTKPTREFVTSLGVFSYQLVKRSVFTGYHAVSLDGQTVFLAEPEKALADYLYFVDLKKTQLNDRLDLRHLNRKKLIMYARLFKRQSLLKLVRHLYVEQRQPRQIY